jgi:hypothetical protein
MDWNPTDDPCEEHCYHIPLCVFVRYIKGAAYVKEYKTKRQMQAASKEWNCHLM